MDRSSVLCGSIIGKANTVQIRALHFGAVHYCAVKYNTKPSSPVYCSAVHYSEVQCSSVVLAVPSISKPEMKPVEKGMGRGNFVYSLLQVHSLGCMMFPV